MQRIVTALIFFFAAIALGFFYTLPQWQKYKQLGSDVKDLEQVSAEFDQLIANRDSLLDRINSITKENLDRLDNMLPQGPHTSDLLVTLEALTLQNSVALGRVDLVNPDSAVNQPQQAQKIRPLRSLPDDSASPPAQQPPTQVPAGIGMVQIFPFSIQVVGSYDNFKKLLASMEKSLRLMDVDGVSFNAGGKGDESLVITLKAKTYYQ